jgi:hypothetical protein
LKNCWTVGMQEWVISQHVRWIQESGSDTH